MQERELYRSANLTQSLTDVFTTIGETAYKSETPICFFIDEIQYMKAKEQRNRFPNGGTITKGYPFFIQQICQIVYQNTDEKKIKSLHVEHNIDEFFQMLDIGFFKVRYERCADSDKKFIFAMIRCGELPCINRLEEYQM